jgi:hypothetical protein
VTATGVGGGGGAGAASVFVAGFGSAAGNNCNTNHFRPSELKVQTAAVKFATAPLAV